MLSVILIAVGGAFGAVLRFHISIISNKHYLGTFVVNIVGSCLLAISFRLYLDNILTEAWWLFAGVGFCGAFTTFSTFGSEVIQLLLAKKYQQVVYYSSSSFIISILTVYTILHL